MCGLNPFACLTVPFKNKQAAARKAVEAEAVAAASTAAVSAGVKLPPPQDFAELPACARFYLERVGAAKDNFTLVTARQMGGFRHGKNLPWKVLDATQVVSPRVPAFFWTASCGFKPMMGLKGFDCRAGGQSKVDWRFWGWLPALSGSGQATDRAMLVRWLAEAPGYPQALLPSDLLRWEAVKGSENQARAVLSHSGTTVSGIFTFDEAGLVASFRSDDYTRPLPGGATETRTWIVRYSDHKLVPVKGALGGGKLVPAMYKAYRVEPSGEEYCYVMFAFEGVKAN